MARDSVVAFMQWQVGGSGHSAWRSSDRVGKMPPVTVIDEEYPPLDNQ
jgi:hypothetical protein